MTKFIALCIEKNRKLTLMEFRASSFIWAGCFLLKNNNILSKVESKLLGSAFETHLATRSEKSSEKRVKKMRQQNTMLLDVSAIMSSSVTFLAIIKGPTRMLN